MRVPYMSLLVLLASCGGSSSSAPPMPSPALPPPIPISAPAAPIVNVEVGIKQLIFDWADVPDADFYRLLENADGHSGFIQVGSDVSAGSQSTTLPIAVHLHDFANALYMVEACNVAGCNSSIEVNAMNRALDAIGYFKASNAEGAPERFSHKTFRDLFGDAIALSADGKTLAVGAVGEDSFATGINGDQNDNTTLQSGAVYVFRLDGNAWSQQAYIKASNTEQEDRFGHSIALSADGDTLVVGAPREDSNAKGIDGNQDNNLAGNSGAAYVFHFDSTGWYQQAYIKASNTRGAALNPDEPRASIGGEEFGSSIALSADGRTMVVGAPNESGAARGINGDQNAYTFSESGAVYVFRQDGNEWSQQAYIKASNALGGRTFGIDVGLSGDGNTLAVAAPEEYSNATDSLAGWSGAAYVFRFDNSEWFQEAHVKGFHAEDPPVGNGDSFGAAIALSLNGNTLAVGAPTEDSAATGVNGDQSDNSAEHSGAAYVFRFSGTNWNQQSYLKASNQSDRFGTTIALNQDGNVLVVGSPLEVSTALGINGDQTSGSWNGGAGYVFRFDGSDWAEHAYVKASNHSYLFGTALAISSDGNSLAVGAPGEASAATGINGDQSDQSAYFSGAVYVY